MQTVKIYRLHNLPPKVASLIYEGQREAARVWNFCKDLHKEARINHTRWASRNDLHRLTKGKFALCAQTVQQINQAFLANVDATREVRKQNRKIRYPWKDKRFYPLLFPSQAISIKLGRVVLPMGRGRQSIVLKLDLPEKSGGCKLVWNDGYELHVSVEHQIEENNNGNNQATVDLGEIHQSAVTTNTGRALVVSGRGIRTLKRQRHKALGQIAKKRSRCQKYSRRWKKLQRARRKISSRIQRRVRDLRHKGTRQVIQFCQTNFVSKLYVGNPHGVRNHNCGRHHHQRMASWEYGVDINYLLCKSKQAHISCFTGTERGTSSQCPVCGHRYKPKGRNWKCRKCGFTGHRDLVGSVNMHPIGFGEKIQFPTQITYLRPGFVRSSSSADTRQRCLDKSVVQPPVALGFHLGAGYPTEVIKKPVCL